MHHASFLIRTFITLWNQHFPSEMPRLQIRNQGQTYAHIGISTHTELLPTNLVMFSGRKPWWWWWWSNYISNSVNVSICREGTENGEERATSNDCFVSEPFMEVCERGPYFAGQWLFQGRVRFRFLGNGGHVLASFGQGRSSLMEIVNLNVVVNMSW